MNQSDQQDIHDNQNSKELSKGTKSNSSPKPEKNSPRRRMKKIELPKRIITTSLSESASDDKYKRQIEDKVQADILSPKSQKKTSKKVEIPKQLINDPFKLAQESINKEKAKKRPKEENDSSYDDIHREINYDIYIKDPNSKDLNIKRDKNKVKKKTLKSDGQADSQDTDGDIEKSHSGSINQAHNQPNSSNLKSKGANANNANSPFSSNNSSSNENRKTSRSPFSSPVVPSSDYHSRKSNKSQSQQQPQEQPNLSNQIIIRQTEEQPPYNVNHPMEQPYATDSNYTYDYVSLPTDFDRRQLEELIKKAKKQNNKEKQQNYPQQVFSRKIDNREFQEQEQFTVQSETWEEEDFEEEDFFLDDEEEEIYEGEYFLDENDEDESYTTEQQENSTQYDEYGESTYEDSYESNGSEIDIKSNSIHNRESSPYSRDYSTPKQYRSPHRSHHQHTHTPISKIDKNYFSASGKKLIRVKKYKNNYYPSPTPTSSLPFELPPEQEPSPKGIETRNKHQFASKVAFSDDELRERNANLNCFENQFRPRLNENVQFEEEEEEDIGHGSSINDDDILSFFQVSSEEKWRNNRDTYNFFHLNDKNNNYSTTSTKSVNNEKSYSSNNNNSKISSNNSKIDNQNSKVSNNSSKISANNSKVSNNSSKISNNNSKISNNNSKISNNNSKISNNNSKISNSNSKISRDNSYINCNSKISNSNYKIDNHNSKISNKSNESAHDSTLNQQSNESRTKDDNKVSIHSSKLSNHSSHSRHGSSLNAQPQPDVNMQERNIGGNDEIKGIETVTSVYSQTSPLPQKSAHSSRNNSELSQRSNKSQLEPQNSVHSSASAKKCSNIQSQRVDENVQTSLIEDRKDDEKTQTSIIEDQKEDENTQTNIQDVQEDDENVHHSSSSFLSVFSAISDDYRRDVQYYQQHHKDNRANSNSRVDKSFSIPYDPPDSRFIKRDVKIEDDDRIDSILSESLSSGSDRNVPSQISNSRSPKSNSSKSNSIPNIEKVKSDSNKASRSNSNSNRASRSNSRLNSNSGLNTNSGINNNSSINNNSGINNNSSINNNSGINNNSDIINNSGNSNKADSYNNSSKASSFVESPKELSQFEEEDQEEEDIQERSFQDRDIESPSQEKHSDIEKPRERASSGEQPPQTPGSASSHHHTSNSESFFFSEKYANVSSSTPVDTKFTKQKEASTSRIETSEPSSYSQEKRIKKKSPKIENSQSNSHISQSNSHISQSNNDINPNSQSDSHVLSDILKSETVTLNFPEVVPPDIWDKTSSGSGIKKKSSEQSDSLKELIITDSSSLEIHNNQLQPLQYKLKSSVLNESNINNANEIQNSNSGSSSHHKKIKVPKKSSNKLDSNSFSVTSNSDIHISEVVDDIDQISRNVDLNSSELGSVIIPTSSASRNVSMSSESSSKSGKERRSHSKQKSRSKSNKDVVDGLSDVSAFSETSSAKNDMSNSDFADLAKNKQINNNSSHNSISTNPSNDIIILNINNDPEKKGQSSKLSFQTLSNVSSNFSGEFTDFTLGSKDSVLSDINSNE